jgi:ABC-type bacteriocin/lantibiotic exporter with double-glycine peptidase domain
MSSTSGNILFNGRVIALYNLHSLRKRVTYIPAEPFIFTGKLKDNFIWENPSNSLIDVDKYSHIAKGGSNLSSGEKKKLQLAVGMHQNSDIFILDEPLNFVDEVSKKEIVETIKNEFSSKTLIIISHESSPFDFCQHKYLMKNGNLQKL